jgi:hypothetical protein
VAYEIATGVHKSILPQNMGGTGAVTFMRGEDGTIYAIQESRQVVKLERIQCNAYSGQPVQRTPQKTLADGRHLLTKTEVLW